MKKFKNTEAAAIFSRYPARIRTKLMFLRQLIFDVAHETKGVGELEETIKWGQPSYLTSQSKSGTAIRLDQVKLKPGVYAIYVHCQTPLIATFKEMYGSDFTYEKNRAIHFRQCDKIPVKKLRQFIAMALTYHLDSKESRLIIKGGCS